MKRKYPPIIGQRWKSSQYIAECLYSYPDIEDRYKYGMSILCNIDGSKSVWKMIYFHSLKGWDIIPNQDKV